MDNYLSGVKDREAASCPPRKLKFYIQIQIPITIPHLQCGAPSSTSYSAAASSGLRTRIRKLGKSCFSSCGQTFSFIPCIAKNRSGTNRYCPILNMAHLCRPANEEHWSRSSASNSLYTCRISDPVGENGMAGRMPFRNEGQWVNRQRITNSCLMILLN